METVDLVLAAAPLFQGVDPDALRTALTGSHELMLSGGKTLLDPAESNNEIFVILDGEMLVCLEPDPTNPIVRLGTGECVGELSIIDARPPSAYVITAGPCRVLAIPQAVLWNLLASQQPTAFNLLRILTRRIRENNAVILSTLELRREQSRKVETDEVTGLRTRAWADTPADAAVLHGRVLDIANMVVLSRTTPVTVRPGFSVRVKSAPRVIRCSSRFGSSGRSSGARRVITPIVVSTTFGARTLRRARRSRPRPSSRKRPSLSVTVSVFKPGKRSGEPISR